MRALNYLCNKCSSIYIVILIMFVVGVAFGVLMYAQIIKKEIVELKMNVVFIPEKVKSKNLEKTLTIQQVENTSYGFLGGVYSLVDLVLRDGMFLYTLDPSMAEQIEIKIYNNKVAFGDIDGDGDKDAVVILTSHYGGTGNFRELAILLNDDLEPNYINKISLGDRVQINSIVIEQERIFVDMLVHDLNDGMCCPSILEKKIYQLKENKIIENIDTSDWQTYRNEEYGFEVKYPESIVENRVCRIFEFPTQEQEYKVRVGSLHITVGLAGGQKPSNFADDQIKSIEDSNRNFEMENKELGSSMFDRLLLWENVIISGENAIKIVEGFSGANYAEPVHIFVLGGSNIYTLQYDASDDISGCYTEEYPSEKELAELIVSTFRLY